MTKTRRSRFVRGLLLASAGALTGLLSIAPGHAKTDFGVRGGTYSDVDEPFLGAEALFGVGTTNRWFGNPNLEHAFAADSGDRTAVSFDFHYDFPSGEPYTFWAGAGPTLIFRDRTSPGTAHDTDPGVNLVLGIGARKGDVRPYGQMKVVLADDSEAVLGVGVRF
ncbi:MAG: hypothetical protein DMF50_04235 [Acidobacteria bacterium]|nr:MAG: hypothetical protein DMF50_04235 [Acidobacteriota bacterium]